MGLVSVAAHVVGSELKELIESFPSDPARARKIHQRLMPVFKALFAFPSPVPVKYATSLNGFDCESVRLPLVPLNEDQKAVVRKAVAEFGRVPA
jgi:4-hydroxy-tetrahydrodipicolinate synthase